MYGKHFASMYTGSMVGAGFGPYAVMGYVIANQAPDKQVGFQVELNVKILAATFGEPEEYVQKAIDYLCAPDPETRTAGEEGRRLVKIGTYAYRVVNGAHYHAIRNEEQRREQNRQAQAKFRSKKDKPNRMLRQSHPSTLPGEAAGVRCLENGDERGAEQIQEATLPPQCNEGAANT